MTKTAKAKVRKTGAARGRNRGEQIVALLRRPAGASMAEVMKATGWQAHSVRGFLSGTLRKKRNIDVGSAVIEGTRRYRIAGEGAEA